MAFQLGGATAGVTGGVVGNINVKNAFRIRFTTTLSGQPRLEAWDGATDLNANISPSDEILAGTASTGNNSWLAGADCSVTRPVAGTVGTPWYPSGESPGSSPSLIQGASAYVALDAVTVGVATRQFNLALKAPSDALYSGSTQHSPVIVVRYYYTGTAPGVIWQRNQANEASPVWATMTASAGGDKLHFNGPNSSAIYNDPFTKPNAIAEVDGYWLATNGETY